MNALATIQKDMRKITDVRPLKAIFNGRSWKIRKQFNKTYFLGQWISLPSLKTIRETCGCESVNEAFLPCHPPARPLGRRQYLGDLKGCGVKTAEWIFMKFPGYFEKWARTNLEYYENAAYNPVGPGLIFLFSLSVFCNIMLATLCKSGWMHFHEITKIVRHKRQTN